MCAFEICGYADGLRALNMTCLAESQHHRAMKCETELHLSHFKIHIKYSSESLITTVKEHFDYF